MLGTAGPALALYTVAAVRDTFTAVLSVTALAVWQLLYGVTLHGLSDRDGLDLALTALLYATACGAGLRARHARRARLTAARGCAGPRPSGTGSRRPNGAAWKGNCTTSAPTT